MGTSSIKRVVESTKEVFRVASEREWREGVMSGMEASVFARVCACVCAREREWSSA